MIAAARLLAPARWVRQAVRESGREREGSIQAAKMAVAAVIAWLVAQQVDPSQSFIAPYAAVFMMSETVYRPMTNAVHEVRPWHSVYCRRSARSS